MDKKLVIFSKKYRGETIGTYTIVTEQMDANGKTWGKLKSGLGWVCVSDIQS